MKVYLSLILLFTLAAAVVAQETRSPDDLRIQLIETQAKQTELEARVRQLDEQLKPENIERSLAGVGSTKPEELRELRRRQLTIERDGVMAQLKLVNRNRERLESSVAVAEGQAYLKSAEPVPPTQLLKLDHPNSRFSWSTAILTGGIALLAVLAIVSLRKLTLR